MRSSFIFGGRSNKIVPLSQSDLRYSEILFTVRRGNLLTKDEIEFVKGLSKSQKMVIVETYKTNLFKF
jgi:hypothetical protein